jgi:hypothetical protein
VHFAPVGLPPPAPFTLPNSGELVDAGGHLPVHSSSVASERWLAGGSMCWVSSCNACQHIGATPGVQTTKLQCMTHGSLDYTDSTLSSHELPDVVRVGCSLWNMIVGVE